MKMAVDFKEAMRQIASAKVNGGGEFIKAGTYTLEVQKIIFEQMRKGLTFVGEFGVVEAHETSDTAPNKVGASVKTVINFHGNGADMAGANVKSFVCGLFGMDDASVSEDDISDVILGGKDEDGTEVPGLKHASQPARGMLVKCVATPIKTKAGNDFTKLSWYPVENDSDAVAARRAVQEGKKAA